MVATENGDAEAAMTGPLPKADVPLEINVLPFADPKAPQGSSLAVIVGVTQPNGGRGMARSERVRIVTTAYNPETGQSVGSQQHELDLQWNATGQETGRFEVLSRLPLKPGRYEIRVGVEAGDGRTGSVYTYADVPDFRKNGLSLSGLVLNVTPSASRGAGRRLQRRHAAHAHGPAHVPEDRSGHGVAPVPPPEGCRRHDHDPSDECRQRRHRRADSGDRQLFAAAIPPRVSTGSICLSKT